ncbi:glycoside hydrolase superfamily [Phaeosphaeria sp. MPI-PUGE-AT-0046c]|nr:glycoside hydrolase superfamily [Phaeosphaeria sp. MPI-PUGE-AT-0046c]
MSFFLIPFQWLVVLLSVLPVLSAQAAESPKLRYIMYLTGQHNVVPQPSLVADVTHVALAFMRSDIFNDVNRTEWPLFTTIDEVRPRFAPGTVIQVAIGGWGDTASFDKAAQTDESRALFAKNVKKMLDQTGADGVDVDWEYPGGNGEDYKTTPNEEKVWEIAAYPKLLSAIRNAIGPEKTISAAVPGLPRDLLAFTHDNVPKIMESVDFFNIMTYDLMNRRDNVTKHHTGIHNSLEAIDAYLERGLPADKANLGRAYYVKWFNTADGVNCHKHPIGCEAALMEDSKTGADLGKAGAFSWHDTVPNELLKSFVKATKYGTYDKKGGGYYYWDETEQIFWSWETESAISKKLPATVGAKKLGGVFAWGLGEDAPQFDHLKATTRALKELSETAGGNVKNTA